MKQIQSLAYFYAVSSCSTCKEWPHKKYIKISILYLTDFLKVTKAVYIKKSIMKYESRRIYAVPTQLGSFECKKKILCRL